MSRTTLRFLKGGMAYFVLGTLLGLCLALPPARDALFALAPGRWDLVHTHLNLLGFVVMVIFGVAYHILPRFAGRPLRSEAWAGAHFWLAFLSTAGMAVGFALPPAAPLLWAGSAGQFAGIVLGVLNLWLTIR